MTFNPAYSSSLPSPPLSWCVGSPSRPLSLSLSLGSRCSLDATDGCGGARDSGMRAHPQRTRTTSSAWMSIYQTAPSCMPTT
jgi:hypothetical protein